MPDLLPYVKDWAPFSIDALGLVTILGAEEVNRALGRLLSPAYTDYLPLLGGYVVAGDYISNPIPSFRLYNVDDGIVRFDITPWFGRWLATQPLTSNSTFLYIRAVTDNTTTTTCSLLHRWLRWAVSVTLGVVFIAAPLVFALVIDDWWGFANALSMLVNVLVRREVVRRRATGLRHAYDAAGDKPWPSKIKRLIVLTPDGKAVIVYADTRVVVKALIAEKAVPGPRVDYAWRALGWLAFGTHVVTLGMAKLAEQLVTVVVLVASTLLVVWTVGADKDSIADRFHVSRFDESHGHASRARLYERLDLSPDEEQSLVSWELFPARSNTAWWDNYRKGMVDSDRSDLMAWKRSVGLVESPMDRKKSFKVVVEQQEVPKNGDAAAAEKA